MSIPTVCVFEDEKSESFLPLTYTRPVFDLRCGMRTLFQKIAHAYQGCNHRQLCRPYLARTANAHDTPSFLGESRRSARGSDPVLFVNGRVLACPDVAHEIEPEGEDALFVSGQDLLAARLSGPRLTVALKWLAEQDTGSIMASIAQEVPVKRLEARLVEYPWDLVQSNGLEIAHDFDREGLRGRDEGIHPGATVYNPDAIHVSPAAEVMSTVVLDARSGPIIVDEGAVIEPFSFIQGPTYIGPHARIVSGRIRSATTIGPYCRIGGEVEASIFQGYSNKYHDGFAGHSYFGEWVNIGALTTTSDLKNTYGSVRVDVQGSQVDTGLTKLGAIVGDHVKLGIGVLLNSGSTIGTGCNLFGGGMLPKIVPCFVWGGDGAYQEYDFERMLETAQIAMSRREVEQTGAHTDLLRYIFDITAPLRRAGRI